MGLCGFREAGSVRLHYRILKVSSARAPSPASLDDLSKDRWVKEYDV